MISYIQIYLVKSITILVLLKQLLTDKYVCILTLIPTIFIGAYSNKIHSVPTPEKPEAGKMVNLKAAQPLQATKPIKARYLGPEGMNYPVRKTLIPPVLTRESKTSETKERGKSVQSKDSQRAKHLPCSSDFCNGRGICTMEREMRKCSCPLEYGREFCEEAVHGLVPGHITLSLTIALSVILVALGAFVYFRREHKLKRCAAINVLLREFKFFPHGRVLFQRSHL